MLHKISVLFLVLVTANVKGKLEIKAKEVDSGVNAYDVDNTLNFFKFWSQTKAISNYMEKRQYTNFIVGIPPHQNGAKVARYIVHNLGWASLASISLIPEINGYPFADVVSFSDGPVVNSTGVPYLYMTPLDLTAKNIEKDNRCSLSLTLAGGNYCKQKHFDPEDPRCAHVVLTGKLIKVEKGSADEMFARNALFSRHPAMKNWPKDHNWFFAKLQIEKICLLDYFGGPKYVSVDDYFHAMS